MLCLLVEVLREEGIFERYNASTGVGTCGVNRPRSRRFREPRATTCLHVCDEFSNAEAYSTFDRVLQLDRGSFFCCCFHPSNRRVIAGVGGKKVWVSGNGDVFPCFRLNQLCVPWRMAVLLCVPVFLDGPEYGDLGWFFFVCTS